MNDSGYLPLSRKIFNHDLFKEKREFSKFEAWIDLLQMASYDQEEKTKLIGLNIIKWGRGQLPASVRFLQTRWQWGSTKRVFMFLEMLKKGNMISIEKETGQNIITICKYDTYNIISNEWKREGNTKETRGKREGNETNKDNKENNNICAFEKFWDAYGKKSDRKKCELVWSKLSTEQKLLVIEKTPAYVLYHSDPKYRKNPLTFLNGANWNDEIPVAAQTEIELKVSAKKTYTQDEYNALWAPKH